MRRPIGVEPMEGQGPWAPRGKKEPCPVGAFRGFRNVAETTLRRVREAGYRQVEIAPLDV